MKSRKALIVKTDSGKKGFVYYAQNKDLDREKIEVHVIDDVQQKTGEKILVSPNKMIGIGYKD